MTFPKLALIGLGLIAAPTIARGQAPSAKGEPELKSMAEKISYTLGQRIGKSMKAGGVEADVDILARGIRDALAGKSALTDDQLDQVQQAFEKEMMAKQQALAGQQQERMMKEAAAGNVEAAKTLKAGQDFLAENKGKPDVKTLPSGVQYKVIKAGTGKSPTLTDTVVANYRGTLIDGTKFDASDDHGGPSEFPVNGVIPGWTEILQKMKIGDKYQVFIPANLAYGARARGPFIKANSALIFDIELLEVK